jgi:hypothetical protein
MIDFEKVKQAVIEYNTAHDKVEEFHKEMNKVENSLSGVFRELFVDFNTLRPLHNNGYESSIINFHELHKEWAYLGASCVKTKKSFVINSAKCLWISPDYGVKRYRVCKHWNPWSSCDTIWEEPEVIVHNYHKREPAVKFKDGFLGRGTDGFDFKVLKNSSQLNQERVALFQEITEKLNEFHLRACNIYLNDMIESKYKKEKYTSAYNMWSAVGSCQNGSLYSSIGHWQTWLENLDDAYTFYLNVTIKIKQLEADYLAYLSQVKAYNIAWKTLNQIKSKRCKIV